MAKSVANIEDKLVVEIRVELWKRGGNIESEGYRWAEVMQNGKV